MLMANKIIAAGHICLDITPVFSTTRSVSKLEELLVPGKLIHMNPADVHTGGSVANTGLALKILGNDVRLLGKIGDDEFGSMVKNILAQYGTGGLITDEKSSTSYSVVLAVPGLDRIFLHNPGANDSFDSGDIPDEALEDAALFHFGYPPLMRKMYENSGEELRKIFARAKEKGVATSLDFAAVDPESDAGKAEWKAVLKNVLPYVDFFVPSFEELCFMLDRRLFNELAKMGGDMTEGLDLECLAMPLCEKCIAMGAKVAVIKCGSSGMCYRTADRDAICSLCESLQLDLDEWADKKGTKPCFKPDALRSATGAGDTSIAAFLTAVMMRRAPDDAVTLAAAEGAASVTSYDALGGILSIEELERRLKDGWEVL